MPLSEKKRASNAKWDSEHLKRMSLAVPLEMYEQMQTHVTQTGESMNGFIKRSITEALNKQTDGTDITD